MILWIIGRFRHDRVRSSTLYSWLHRHKIKIYPAAITAATLKLRFFCKLHDPRATESLTLKILFSELLGPRPKSSRYLHPDVRAISDAIKTLRLIPDTTDITAFQASLEDARDAAFQEWITQTDIHRETKRLSLLPPEAHTPYEIYLKECRTSHVTSLSKCFLPIKPPSHSAAASAPQMQLCYKIIAESSLSRYLERRAFIALS